MARPQPAVIERLGAILNQQDGFVTTAQAKLRGIDDARLVRLVQDGYLERVLHGVYRVNFGARVPSLVREDLYVRYLALDAGRLPWEPHPTVVASHESAADLHRIGNLPADVATFTSSTRRSTTIGATRIRVASLDRDDWEFIERGRIPVTTVARTIVDLSISNVGRDYVERALDDALARRMVTSRQLKDVIDRRRRPSQQWIADHARTTTGSAE
ncbi:MAG: hypothetical protein JWM90_3004 [Thermoleophilia bacterium]|nr:hypothetical protein [Thermoleophilia bacterium]